MTDERLKEIKDSIDFQLMIGTIKGHTLDVINEELELYNEVIRLRETLINKPDTEWTLKTEDGQIMTIIQSERIDMQETLNKTITTLYERINKAIEYLEEPSRDNFDYSKARLIEILRGEDK